MTRASRREALVATLVGIVAFLPFLRGVVSGASLYFRDLALYFFPLRRLALDGLRDGEVRFWNPYLHEGVPLSLPALGYPVDLLQVLRPDEVGLSLILALHVPLAALGLYTLARRHLAVPPVAAAGAGLVYALGGFLLSSVNLYVFVQAAAWAPLVVLTLAGACVSSRPRTLAGAALVTALALSTTGVEVVAQAVVIGLVLGWRRGSSPRGLAAAGLALGLATALAAPVLLLLVSQLGGSARSQGFATDVVLAHSIHPFTLLQTVVSGLYGNPSNLAGEWWGQNFFPRGFPYILSLYVGAAALAVALTGATGHHPRRWRLHLLLAGGLLLSLGRWAGLSFVVEAVPGLSSFRYPVKAFFTVHLAVSLLVGLGLHRLANEDDRRGWRQLALAAATLGVALAGTPLLPRLAPSPVERFSAAFFPPGLGSTTRDALLSGILADAAVGGVLALAVAAVGALALRGALATTRAGLLVVALLAADLLRAGAGLNPMVDGSFFQPSPPLASALPSLRDRGRVFTCAFEDSPSYQEARRGKGAHHEVWTFAVALETLTPAFNVPLGVSTALSPDLTMLVPEERVLSPAEAGCHDPGALVPLLRRAAVHTVVSLEPLAHPRLRLRRVLAPERIAPLNVRLYELEDPLPRTTLEPTPGSVEEAWAATDGRRLQVETDFPSLLVVRDGWAPGWTARVDGRPVPVERTEAGHLAVTVPAGRSVVELEYHPPGLSAGLLFSLLALIALVLLARRPRRRSPPGPAPSA